MQVHRPLNQVLSSLVDQEVGHQVDNPNLGPDELHQTYTMDEFEVRILEPEKSGGPWLTKATIPMQNSENALTVRVVILFVSYLFLVRCKLFSSLNQLVFLLFVMSLPGVSVSFGSIFFPFIFLLWCGGCWGRGRAGQDGGHMERNRNCFYNDFVAVSSTHFVVLLRKLSSF